MSGPSFNVASTLLIPQPGKQTTAGMAEDINSLVKKRTQEIYKAKCTNPSVEDVLNFIYDMQDGKEGDFASRLYQAWDAADAAFGLAIRKHIERCFLEVAEIEALEEIEECVCGF